MESTFTPWTSGVLRPSRSSRSSRCICRQASGFPLIFVLGWDTIETISARATRPGRAAVADFYGADYDVEVDDSLAVKGGLGVNWFVLEQVALNGEAAWKLNRGDAAETLDGLKMSSGEFNGSSIALRLGVRVFF